VGAALGVAEADPSLGAAEGDPAVASNTTSNLTVFSGAPLAAREVESATSVRTENERVSLEESNVKYCCVTSRACPGPATM